jgi:hypothetical protein
LFERESLPRESLPREELDPELDELLGRDPDELVDELDPEFETLPEDRGV